MSTTPNLGLTYLTSGQLQPEVTINNDLNMLDGILSPAAAFGNNAVTTTGLTYGYYGGYLWSGTTETAIAAGTIALTASATNYVQMTTAGAVSVNTVAFTSGQIPMATVVTSASGITSIADKRPLVSGSGSGSVTSVGLSLPLSIFTVSGSPVTTTGTITGTLATQTANFVFAGPGTGTVAAPTFRAVVAADIPQLTATQMPAFSGDATSTAGSTTLTLATSGVTAGTYGSSSLIPVPTVDAKGRITSITQVSASSGFANPMTAVGDLISGGTSGAAQRLVVGSNGQILTVVAGAPAWGAAAGTVTSVGLSLPALFTVTGSPVTGSGTLTGAFASQTANYFLAAPNGAAGAPSMRAIVPADIPVFVASGVSAATGAVPSPGTTAGTTRYLREDATWQSVTTGVSSWNSRTGAVMPATGDYTFAQIGSKPTTLSGYGITDGAPLTGGGTSGTWGISVTGNAGSATVLQTSRTINGVAFNGSANITIGQLDVVSALTNTSGTVPINCALGNTFTLVLGANVTTISISNPLPSGQPTVAIIQISQDATGGRTVGGWPAAVKWAGGTAYTASSAASAVDTVSLLSFDGGTSWQGIFNKAFA